MSKRKLYQLYSNKKSNRDSSSDDESDDDIKQNPLLPLFHPHHDNTVFKLDNHIYFTTDVAKTSINKLVKLIYKINRDYDLMKNTLYTIGNVEQDTIQPKPIYLHIDSPGGSLLEGFRAMDIIKTSKVPIYTIIEGHAASAGSMMFLAGKRRFMTETSYMLIHQLSQSAGGGSFEEMKDDYLNNTQFMDKIINIYYKASKHKLKKTELKNILKHDLYWDYDTCKKYNLVDEIYKP